MTSYVVDFDTHLFKKRPKPRSEFRVCYGAKNAGHTYDVETSCCTNISHPNGSGMNYLGTVIKLRYDIEEKKTYS